MLSCGCVESLVRETGHRASCVWAGAKANSYPGVRQWQRLHGGTDSYADEQVAKAIVDRAPLDAVYPSHDGVWRTYGQAFQTDGFTAPWDRMPVTSRIHVRRPPGPAHRRSDG